MMLLSLCYIILIACFKGYETSANVWQSGVIGAESAAVDDPPGLLGSIFKPVLESIYDEDRRKDNFVFATVPLKRVNRCLFVTPHIAKTNPDAVKETFVRLYCNLLGILFRDRELSLMTRGRFFKLLPHESREKLISCLSEFEKLMELNLQLAMIDLGPDDLDGVLTQVFNERDILLLRHPMNIVNGEMYYTKDTIVISEYQEAEAYPWYDPIKKTRLRNSGSLPYVVYKTYEPTLPQCEEEMLHEAERKRKLSSELEGKISETMERLYGHFEEVPLKDADEAESINDTKDTKGSNNHLETTTSGIEDEDYEFV